MEYEQDEEESRSESRGTSTTQLHQQDSELGDHDCGEPLQAQRILIDFTIDEELDQDSEYNQAKCRDFWAFIKTKPELQNLMAVPEIDDYGESFMSSEYQQSEPRSESPGESGAGSAGAISTLQLVQKKDRMTPALLGAVARSHCSLGSREYPEPGITVNKAKKKGHVCSCKGSCDLCRRSTERRSGRVQASATAADLCQTIDKWDAEHPKSMEPPTNIYDLQKNKFSSNGHK